MSHPKYVDKIEGKTVEKVSNGGDRILMRFTDGTFTSVKCKYHDDGDVMFSEPTDEGDLLDIGVITKEEIEATRVKREAECAAIQKESRRRSFERLKKEFEPETK